MADACEALENELRRLTAMAQETRHRVVALGRRLRERRRAEQKRHVISAVLKR